ncbi:MIP family channel protein [Nocardioides albidus]|uniref:MIP family channel protein n=1 Tax=Nocardioides albidus TaxID=1517589 RepID=A0A5C4VYR1_9ACTN|nr:MIP family channel protein [Nocardioides albidus]TNM40385.1 MIP family channel protein [Nocardioides albidus]
MTDEAVETSAPPTLFQKIAAEALGTAVLVYLGCGSAVFFGNVVDDLGAGLFAITSIGLTFGIAIVAMAYTFGRVSGGHFNPAVSLGAALGGRISWKDAGLYSAAQIVGGLVGGLLLALTALSSDFGWEFGEPLGANGFGDHGGVELLGALLIEFILTFIFVTVILGTTDERNRAVAAMAPLTIGLTLAAIHFVAIPATSTSVNPARSIGVAFFSGSDAIVQLWLFIVAPLLGGAIAGVLYPAIFGRGADPVPGSGLNFGSGGSSDPGFTQQWNQQAYGQQPFGQHQAQPGQQAQAQQTGQQQAQPIIQDGWQWDPAAQQWIPAQQQPAAPGSPGAPGSTGASDPQGGWAPPANDQTQVRPPQ